MQPYPPATPELIEWNRFVDLLMETNPADLYEQRAEMYELCPDRILVDALIGVWSEVSALTDEIERTTDNPARVNELTTWRDSVYRAYRTLLSESKTKVFNRKGNE